MFGHHWQPGEGTFVDVRVITRSGSGAHAHIERGFLMDVRPSSGEPFRTEIREPQWSSFVPPTVPGEVVKVKCDPARKEARFDTHAQKEEQRSFEQADAERYQAELHAGLPEIEVQGTPLVTTAAGVAQPDIADQLTKLADLRDRGALTDAEFEAQKAKLLAR